MAYEDHINPTGLLERLRIGEVAEDWPDRTREIRARNIEYFLRDHAGGIVKEFVRSSDEDKSTEAGRKDVAEVIVTGLQLLFERQVQRLDTFVETGVLPADDDKALQQQ